MPSDLYDVAILGSGIAGLTCARQLKQRGVRKVVVIEAARYDFLEKNEQKYYEGRVAETSCPHAPPDTYRTRAIGGTSHQWGGGLVLFEPDDFESSDSDGGRFWPLKMSDMEPWAAAASISFGLKSKACEREMVSSSFCLFKDPRPLSGFSTSAVIFRRWKNLNFTKHLNNFEIKVGTAAIDILHNGDGPVVIITRDQVNQIHGQIRAKKVVVALGGLESTRFFLNSPYLMKNVKNPDLVGRYYSCHISGSLGLLVGKSSNGPSKIRTSQLITPDAKYKPFVYTTHSRGFHSMRLNIGHPAKESFNEVLYSQALGSLKIAKLLTSRRLYQVRFDSDQVPNRNSCIRLSSQIAADGLPALEINHEVLDADWARIKRVSTHFGEQINDIGYNLITNDDSSLRSGILGQSHHLGSLRMANDPKSGICNSDLEVFGVPNVFLLSGAVFPSYSFANPTYTVNLLACRLAKFLADGFYESHK